MAMDYPDLEGPESITMEELEAEFERLEKDVDIGKGEGSQSCANVSLDQVFDISELENVRRGVVPLTEVEEITVHVDKVGEKWDPKSLLQSLGM
jgi:hypothetical protein